MHEKAKFVCFNYMQPQKVKFKSVQINMKQVSYSKTCVKQPLKISKTKISITISSLMEVKNNAEWSVLQYF